MGGGDNNQDSMGTDFCRFIHIIMATEKDLIAVRYPEHGVL